jgi:hypothetical protein
MYITWILNLSAVDILMILTLFNKDDFYDLPARKRKSLRQYWHTYTLGAIFLAARLAPLR